MILSPHTVNLPTIYNHYSIYIYFIIIIIIIIKKNIYKRSNKIKKKMNSFT